MNSARCCYFVLAVGCATPASALRDDNRRLAATVSELRSDRRAQDRKLRDLQHQLDELRAQAADSAPPALPVEVVAPAALPAAAAPAPDAARVVGVADDGTEIVYEGDAMGVRPADSSPLSDDEPAARRPPRAGPPRTVPARTTPPRAAPVVSEIPVVHERLEVTREIPPIAARAALPAQPRERGSERARTAGDDYRAAVDLVKAARYGDALAALRAFLTRYPRHDYADNAQYWIAEVFYAQRDYPHALAEFRRVIEVYPRGNKVPDALLKSGFCYQAMGQSDKARAMLEQVVRLYPTSESAVLAAKRLETP